MSREEALPPLFISVCGLLGMIIGLHWIISILYCILSKQGAKHSHICSRLTNDKRLLVY